MYLDKLTLIIIAGSLAYIFYTIVKEMRHLEERINDLEDKINPLVDDTDPNPWDKRAYR